MILFLVFLHKRLYANFYTKKLAPGFFLIEKKVINSMLAASFSLSRKKVIKSILATRFFLGKKFFLDQEKYFVCA